MDKSSKSPIINIKLLVAYDGSAYYGWQKTANGPSIEEKLQSALEIILQHKVFLQAASRTDKGVHATGQVVNFLTSKTSIDLNQLCYSLNQLLPKDLIVLDTELAAQTFHPTLDCIGKEYRYYLCATRLQLPQNRHFSWHVPVALDIAKIRQALPSLVGKRCFEAFCNVRSNNHYPDFVREIHQLELNELGSGRLCIIIRGNHFLYKMVRNIVGTLIDIGVGKIALEDLALILESGKRTKAGLSAPAHGLFLHEVFY